MELIDNELNVVLLPEFNCICALVAVDISIRVEAGGSCFVQGAIYFTLFVAYPQNNCRDIFLFSVLRMFNLQKHNFDLVVIYSIRNL